MTTPDVGKDVASLCSKCGDVWHVVVAKVGQEIVQVLCKECGARHRYRNPDKNAAKAPRTARTPSAPRAAPVARVDEPAVAADLSRPTKRYAISETFAVGDRVDHPSFGQGVVELTSEPGKCTVFFATGRRVLVHGKAPAASSGLSRPRPFDHSLPTPGSKPAS
jgi:hypothetical protein